ncbi:cyanate hydratase [Snodgrassella sp. ESL0253]|uniref:cyanate hydratase n=1 Tax=Snodgrassella sp. ESL0253 TaxID=2705031 RepID=UPI001EECC3F2|nr:cyanate hydratase [Snodgrassella sp. ESL0253]
MSDSIPLNIRQRMQVAIKNGNKAEQQHLWHEYSGQQGFSNEWVMAARLGEPGYTEEQAHMVACLFGRC